MEKSDLANDVASFSSRFWTVHAPGERESILAAMVGRVVGASREDIASAGLLSTAAGDCYNYASFGFDAWARICAPAIESGEFERSWEAMSRWLGYRRQNPSVGKVLDERMPGILARLSASGKGTGLAMAALDALDLTLMQDCKAAGIGFERVGAEERQWMFYALGKKPGPNESAEVYHIYGKLNAAQKAAKAAGREKDRDLFEAAWRLAADMGMGVVEAREPAQDPWGSWQGEASFRMLALEGARGGGLSGLSLWNWAHAHTHAARTGEDLVGGLLPLDYAFKKLGMDPKSWGRQDIAFCLSGWGQVSPEALLGSLAKAGVSVEGQAPKAGRYNTEAWPLAHLAIEAGGAPESFASLRTMGADLEEKDQEGVGPLEKIFSTKRAGKSELALALLEQAELAKAGGRARLLAMRGKDGSGPMHWAARELDGEFLGKLVAWGEDVHARDAKGQTPGHWAARKYGERSKSKVRPALEALGALGFDWSSLDSRGGSALAALAAKGPLEELSYVLSLDPKAATAKSGEAADAMQKIAKRGAAGLSLVEASVIKAEVEALAGEADLPRRKSASL